MSDGLRVRMLSRALILLSPLVILYFIPYKYISDIQVLTLSALISIPIAAYRLEYRLFTRRAIITLGCPPDGLGKKWFWNGGFLKFGNYAISFLISIFLIVIVSSLEKPTIKSSMGISEAFSSLITSEWAIVFSSTLLLILLDGLTLSLTTKHTRGQMAAITQRGIIKWPVVIFLISMSYLMFFFTEHDYYVGKDLAALIEGGFKEQYQAYESRPLGFIQASISVLDTATMYYAQNYIPRISDTATKWILWSYIAIKSAISTGIVIYLMLGVLTLASVRERGGWKLLGRTAFERYFTFTLIIFIAIYMYANRINYSPEISVADAPKFDCNEILASLKLENETRVRELTKKEMIVSQNVERRINETVDRIFAAADPGIEKFLDWHFSVLGEYQQLGAQVAPKVTQGAAIKLQTYVINSINKELQSFGEAIDSDVLAYINESSLTAGRNMVDNSKIIGCFPSVDFTPLTFQKIPVYVGQPQSIIAGGAIAAVIAKKTAAKLTAKTVGKAAGKYAATFATGMTAAGLCGPFAPICGVGAATVTWFAMDAVIVTADELMNRDELRGDIHSELNKQKEKVRQEMLSLKLGGISKHYDSIKEHFRIPTDGI